jgi:hypothetical protein
MFKILEIIIQYRLKQLIINKTIKPLNQCQIGFQNGLGCEVNILKLFLDAKSAYA